jgi:hypothetical protein
MRHYLFPISQTGNSVFQWNFEIEPRCNESSFQRLQDTIQQCTYWEHHMSPTIQVPMSIFYSTVSDQVRFVVVVVLSSHECKNIRFTHILLL